jgi:hypothetical protein
MVSERGQHYWIPFASNKDYKMGLFCLDNSSVDSAQRKTSRQMKEFTLFEHRGLGTWAQYVLLNEAITKVTNETKIQKAMVGWRVSTDRHFDDYLSPQSNSSASGPGETCHATTHFSYRGSLKRMYWLINSSFGFHYALIPLPARVLDLSPTVDHTLNSQCYWGVDQKLFGGLD